MINRFNEISNGKQINVPRHNKSPFKLHQSLNFEIRHKKVKNIDKENLVLLDRIANTKQSINFEDQVKFFNMQEGFKSKLSKAKKLSVNDLKNYR